METIKIVLDNKIRFDCFPCHINPKAHKLWAGKVTNYDENARFSIQLDWLDKKWIDDTLHYTIDNIGKGDIIKVNAGSRNNSYPQYYKILDIRDSEIDIENITEEQVIKEFTEGNRNEIDELRNRIIYMVKVIENKELLEDLEEQIKQSFKDKKVFKTGE
jgi:hypothetical protein